MEATPSAGGCGVSGEPGAGIGRRCRGGGASAGGSGVLESPEQVPCSERRCSGASAAARSRLSPTWAHPQCVIMQHSPPAARAAGASPPGQHQDTPPGTIEHLMEWKESILCLPDPPLLSTTLQIISLVLVNTTATVQCEYTLSSFTLYSKVRNVSQYSLC